MRDDLQCLNMSIQYLNAYSRVTATPSWVWLNATLSQMTLVLGALGSILARGVAYWSFCSILACSMPKSCWCMSSPRVNSPVLGVVYWPFRVLVDIAAKMMDWMIVEDMAFNTCRINIMERLYQESFIGKNAFNKKFSGEISWDYCNKLYIIN